MLRQMTLAAVLALAPPGVRAEMDTDLSYIASQVATETMFRAAIESQRDVLTSAIENDLRKRNISIADMDRFFDIFIDEFIAEFTETMQSETAAIYGRAFTEDEIAGIAEFYRTEAGQALLRRTPAIMQESAQAGQKAGMRAGQNAASRVADRLEREGVVLDPDPEKNRRLIDSLRD